MLVGLDDDTVMMVAEEDVAQRHARGAAGPGPSAKLNVGFGVYGQSRLSGCTGAGGPG